MLSSLLEIKHYERNLEGWGSTGDTVYKVSFEILAKWTTYQQGGYAMLELLYGERLYA